MFGIFLLFLLWPLYFLPTIIALKKNHPHKILIVLVNIFGGLIFGLGLLIALIWCFTDPSETQSTSSSSDTAELRKLYKLKAKESISQEEFDSRKKKILDE